MAENSAIEWTDHTFNPVWGCMKVSPACDNCYAETLSNRFGDHWGAHAEFRTFGDKHWNEPLKWDRAAAKAGKRSRVFCASMADVFDNRWPDGVRERLWALIKETPNLDWLLLTKRPQNIGKMLPSDWGHGYPNVWLGVTVEDQDRANQRIPILLSIRARVRFLSCEPLLGPVDLWGARYSCDDGGGRAGAISSWQGERRIDWVICGGESGAGARPMHPDWARSLRDQCKAAGVAFHFKQWGEYVPLTTCPQLVHYKSPGVTLLPDGSEAKSPQYIGGTFLHRVGKKRAGRLLDGVEHNEFPRTEQGDT